MFYEFRQNNSGGSFNYNERAGITTLVIIEAESAKQANERAENDLGLYFDGCAIGADCSCCGDRWHSVDECDGNKTPSMYGRPLEQWDRGVGPCFSERFDVAIHYADGTMTMHSLKDYGKQLGQGVTIDG